MWDLYLTFLTLEAFVVAWRLIVFGAIMAILLVWRFALSFSSLHRVRGWWLLDLFLVLVVDAFFSFWSSIKYVWVAGDVVLKANRGHWLWFCVWVRWHLNVDCAYQCDTIHQHISFAVILKSFDIGWHKISALKVVIHKQLSRSIEIPCRFSCWFNSHKLLHWWLLLFENLRGHR